jgi:acyl-CoA synthetase (AMP-forming)/AMP-acid ligase II
MKLFSLPRDQIARVVAALCAQTLNARFQRHMDFLAVSAWNEHTALGEEGLGLSAEERAACEAPVAEFFGAGSGLLDPQAATMGAWARAVEDAARARLTTFRLRAASDESRAWPHPAADVYRDAVAAANLFSGRRRVVSFVAPHSLVGFEIAILMPLLQQIPAIDARGVAPDALATALHFGDVVAATPTFWRYLLSHGLRAPNNAMAISCGEEMTAEVATEMRKCGFGALRELYGSTRLGLIAWRDSPSEPFALFDHWRRKGDALARVTAAGEEVEGETSESLQWLSAREFRLGPRRDGAIKVAGAPVFPDRIAAIVGEHPLVAACRVETKRRNSGEWRVVARIRLHPEALPNETTARDIDTWCRARLKPHERPRLLHFESGD